MERYQLTLDHLFIEEIEPNLNKKMNIHGAAFISFIRNN